MQSLSGLGDFCCDGGVRRRLGILSRASFVSLLLATCGGGGEKSIPISQYGDRLLDALCASSVRCEELPDDAICRAVTVVDVAQIVADVGSGKTIYDGAAAAACLDVIAATDCNTSDAITITPEPCRKAFQGTLAAAATCYTNTECVSLSCTLPTTCTEGACCAGQCDAVPVQVAAGGDCSDPQSLCVSSAVCRPGANGVALTCQPRVGVGQPCEDTTDCAAGLFCQVPITANVGSCVRYPARGEPCDLSTLPCNSSLDGCDTQTLRCVPRLTLGAACVPDQGPPCADYAFCDGTSMCAALGSAADGCEVGDCLGSLECIVGACVKPLTQPVCP
jgi:hypothetical protein